MHITIIMLLARWQSDAVLGYVKDVPLEFLTTDYKNKLAAAAEDKTPGSSTSDCIEDKKGMDLTRETSLTDKKFSNKIIGSL